MIFRSNAEALNSGVRMALLGDSFESVTHSFVIRLWLEEDNRAKWRGHITHVPSGTRQYVERLAEIIDFIEPYVDGMEPGRQGRLRRWWSALRSVRHKDGGHRG